MNRQIAPIAVFAFNRVGNLKRTLEALAANELARQSHVTIFCDGPRDEAERAKTDAVRAVAADATGFASLQVVKREQNMGCGPAIIAGLREMFARHEALIVIEDDIVLAHNALQWFNMCLEKYWDTPEVLAIAAWSYPERFMPFPHDYSYDAYFLPRFQCWGWASWRDRIEGVDWLVSDSEEFFTSSEQMTAFAQAGEDLVPTLWAQVTKKINTWDIQVAYSGFKRGMLTLAPRYSYSTNIGTQGEGTHVGQVVGKHPTCYIDLFRSLDAPRLPENATVDKRLLASFSAALNTYILRPSFWRRLLSWVKSMVRADAEKSC